ncbi:hypothetical protein TcWFU_002437 [Taenia crassiceps]|uniref:Uncharacterized protein n=1 Tax=Taenia crassiceps TaxID=6207 RepID=A0ABR4Q627_9CEST
MRVVWLWPLVEKQLAANHVEYRRSNVGRRQTIRPWFECLDARMPEQTNDNNVQLQGLGEARRELTLRSRRWLCMHLGSHRLHCIYKHFLTSQCTNSLA